MKHRRDHARRVDLRLPTVPGPGQRDIRLQPVQASATAAEWASKICCRVASDPMPHSTATDFTGVKTKS